MKNTQKIILSFGFVVTTAFLTHYLFVERIESKDRGIASFGERNSVDQIKWEHNLARDLAAGKVKTQPPSQVSWQDVFVYEFLRGQYDVSVKQGQIEKITLQNQHEGFSIDINQFMKDYGSKMKNYSKFQVKKIDAKQEVVELHDASGHDAGAFLFNRNDQGRVVEIVVQ
jgi:hypothetical protein